MALDISVGGYGLIRNNMVNCHVLRQLSAHSLFETTMQVVEEGRAAVATQHYMEPCKTRSLTWEPSPFVKNSMWMVLFELDEDIVEWVP